jgi:hypothetical protein
LFFDVFYGLSSLGFALGRQTGEILQQLISYREPNKWWTGQFIQQEKKGILKKFSVIPGS